MQGRHVTGIDTVGDDTTTPLQQVDGGLIVSCQPYPDDPLRGPQLMAAMAESVASAGAVGIRANGLQDVQAIREQLDLPLIGLWKDGTDDVFITPTVQHASAIACAGADIVAVDGTQRSRPDSHTLSDNVATVHAEGRALMADVATVTDGVLAEQSGADVVSTTLSGYTRASPHQEGPDLELVAALASRLTLPVIAEGRIHTPAQASQALDAGAWAVVVGTAITAPGWIAAQFIESMQARWMDQGV